MIKQITIQSLFGIFDYDITLKPEGVTIITGPNGFGKSTILKCIESLYKADIYFFVKLDFKSIKFYSSLDESNIEIIKDKGSLYIDDYTIDTSLFTEELLNKSIRRPYYLQMEDDKWTDLRTDETYSSMEIISQYIDDNITLSKRKTKSVEQSSKIKFEELKQKMAKVAGNTRFIQEQRLLTERYKDSSPHTRGGKSIVHTINEIPDRFKKMMNNISTEYSNIANTLDSSYPTRLFETLSGIDENEYLVKFSHMTDKFQKLKKYDISDIPKLKNVEFKKEHAKALKVYFDDFEKKFNVYDSFVKKLELFTEIVNSRLKFKELKISRDDGITVHKDIDKAKLQLSQLSSGEKQEIVLFYELIFETGEYVHLLIDEPEISLHIEWQTKFMDDLLNIAEYKKLNVTIATHSPHIINHHWDIQIDLGEMYEC